MNFKRKNMLEALKLLQDEVLQLLVRADNNTAFTELYHKRSETEW